MRRSYFVANPEETINLLREELWEARHTLCDSLPEQVQKVLRTYYDCVTLEDTYAWLHDVADDLIDLAEPLPRGHFHLGDRACCPLCGDGSSTPYEEGFALPEGLRMHLEGKGNARQCSILKQMWGLAQYHWDGTFHPRGTKAHEDMQAQLKLRRNKEVQFLVSPYLPPRLNNEGMYPGQVRDAKSLAATETRLAAMGFQSSTQERVRSYTKETANAVVYADPRKQRAISFTVVLKPVRSELRRWESRRVPVRHFGMPDSWKRDLEKKLDEAFSEAVKELMPMAVLKLVQTVG